MQVRQRINFRLSLWACNKYMTVMRHGYTPNFTDNALYEAWQASIDINHLVDNGCKYLSSVHNKVPFLW